jgi:cytochrome-b5 reductase
MVKVYPEGQVSQYIHTMDVGDILQCKGPYLGEFEYEPNQYTRYGLLAAGTGITPFVGLITTLLQEITVPQVELIFCNKSEKDILMPRELADWTAEHKSFAVHHILSEPECPSELVMRGHINKTQLLGYLPKPGEKMKVLVCGPPGFIKHCIPLLEELGYTEEMYTALQG